MALYSFIIVSFELRLVKAETDINVYIIHVWVRTNILPVPRNRYTCALQRGPHITPNAMSDLLLRLCCSQKGKPLVFKMYDRESERERNWLILMFSVLMDMFFFQYKKVNKASAVTFGQHRNGTMFLNENH